LFCVLLLGERKKGKRIKKKYIYIYILIIHIILDLGGNKYCFQQLIHFLIVYISVSFPITSKEMVGKSEEVNERRGYGRK
jgi:hypothetical protein